MTSEQAESAGIEEEDRTRCEIWTRVMGYHRPVSSWNPGKQAEHAGRRLFNEPGAANEHEA